MLIFRLYTLRLYRIGRPDLPAWLLTTILESLPVTFPQISVQPYFPPCTQGKIPHLYNMCYSYCITSVRIYEPKWHAPKLKTPVVESLLFYPLGERMQNFTHWGCFYYPTYDILTFKRDSFFLLGVFTELLWWIDHNSSIQMLYKLLTILKTLLHKAITFVFTFLLAIFSSAAAANLRPSAREDIAETMGVAEQISQSWKYLYGI